MPTISQLPVASVVNSADLFVIVQSGVTKQATESLVVAGLGLGTLAFINSPCPAANGGTGTVSPTAHTIPIAEGTSAFNFVGPLTNGQLLIGSTGADPVAASITAGPGVSIVQGAGSLTISGTGSGIGWQTIASSGAMTADNGYITTGGVLVSLSLPATAAVGTGLGVIGSGAGGWSITVGGGQSIQVGSHAAATTSVSSTNQFDSIFLICTVANTVWTVLGGPQGNLTIV